MVVAMTLEPYYYNVLSRHFKIVFEGSVCSHQYATLYDAKVALSQFKFGKDTANCTVEVIEVVFNGDGNYYVRQRLEGILSNYGTEEVDVAGEIAHYAWLAVQWIWNQATEIAGEVLEQVFEAAVDIGVSLITKVISLL